MYCFIDLTILRGTVVTLSYYEVEKIDPTDPILLLEHLLA